MLLLITTFKPIAKAEITDAVQLQCTYMKIDYQVSDFVTTGTTLYKCITTAEFKECGIHVPVGVHHRVGKGNFHIAGLIIHWHSLPIITINSVTFFPNKVILSHPQTVDTCNNVLKHTQPPYINMYLELLAVKQ